MWRPRLIAGITLASLAAAIAVALTLTLGALGDDSRDSDGISAPATEVTPIITAGERGGTSALTPEVTPVIVGDGSAGGFSYLEPVPLVPGEYQSTLASEAAWERGMAAYNAEKGKPQFEGVVNGFRLWSYEHAFTDESVAKEVCGGGNFVEWRLVDKLVFTYLPPGTAAEAPQQEAVCEGGSVGWTGQNLLTVDGPTFTIWYESGERAFAHEAPAERVEAATVQGRPAVIIKPLTEEGFGVTRVAFATDKGFIGVHGAELPLDEALKIAEGVRCESC